MPRGLRRILAAFTLLSGALSAEPAALAGEPLAHPLPGVPLHVAPSRTAPGSARVASTPLEASTTRQPAVPDRGPRPTGRIAVHLSSWRLDGDGQAGVTMNEVVTAVSYSLSDRDDDGLEFGVDVRQSGFTSGRRRNRLSIYDGFVGLRMRDGAYRLRAGHLWLNELGGLGAIAGALFEAGHGPAAASRVGRVRAGVFGGVEPRVYEAGYEPGVRKYGSYVAIQGNGARRHAAGVVRIQNGSLVERSVLVTTNFVPVGGRVFVYQAAECDLERPSGHAAAGWSYFFTNLRVSASSRLDLQATVSRGRSLDARGLSQDVLAGRPVEARAVEGLRYQSSGGRATFEAFRGVRVHGGYSRDTDNRGEAATHRWTAGAHVTDIAGSGFDLTGSDTFTRRPTGDAHARYLSIGRQIGRLIYLSGDYGTSLAVVRFVRGDGLLIESRPETIRFGTSAVVTLSRSVSLLGTADYTRDAGVDDLRVTTGLTYRLR